MESMWVAEPLPGLLGRWPHRPALECLRPQNATGVRGLTKPNWWGPAIRGPLLSQAGPADTCRELRGLPWHFSCHWRRCWGAAKSNTAEMRLCGQVSVHRGSCRPMQYVTQQSCPPFCGMMRGAARERCGKRGSSFLGSHSCGSPDLSVPPAAALVVSPSGECL